MPKTLSINGERKEWLYLLRGRKEAPFAPHEIETVSAPGKDGAHLGKTNVELKRIDQPIGFTVRDEEHEQELLDELNAFLLTQENAEIQFDNVPGKTYIGRVTGSISDYSRPAPTLRKGTITFLCESYKYGPEIEAKLSDQATMINVEGTQAAKPTFTLDVLAPITFAMVSDGDEYMMIGRPVEVDQTVVDTRILLLEEYGESLDTWSSTGTSVDGDVSGEMGVDGTGITIASYGSGDGWHGPAMMKEVDPAQDFEVEMYCRVDADDPDATYRIEFYLFDENNNVLGKMAIMDSTASLSRYSAEARYGEFFGWGTNYKINSENYWRFDNHFHGVLRFRREGQTFKFYVAQVGTGITENHYDSLTSWFLDAENEYQGRLKYVQVHMGTYGSIGVPNVPRINSIKAYELSEELEDETPYIAYEGDQVTFDHENEAILINGEDATYLKDFGASYFELPLGNNNLAVLPGNNKLKGAVHYRPTYK
ncbi:distal tail protein Dit [Alkalibacillus salilacus]|uniref:Phage tail component-like protein n=1 Tax=Alkalibacillus salilacus TaxID=284582 RepID=A0ABT9VDE4_9BACI|nr:distal tail protein Dit [Alkalibacillus salilacus]MDQ0158956.1 putative phage tail component-like protein [Alkalibacillus salilacus]